jgi:PAS domain S-box-containing protein
MIFWGYDRTLRENLQKVWQESLPQHPTKATPICKTKFLEIPVSTQPGFSSNRQAEPHPEWHLQSSCFVPLQIATHSSVMEKGANLLILASSLQVWIQIEPATPYKFSQGANPALQAASIEESDYLWQVAISFERKEIAKLLAMPEIAGLALPDASSFTQPHSSNTSLQKFWANLLQLPQPAMERQTPNSAAAASPQPISIDSLSKYAPIGILHLGLDGGITKANPAFCRLTGYTEAQLRHLDNHRISHPEDFSAEVRIIQQMLNQGQQQHTFRKRYLCCDGSLLWAEVKLSLIEKVEAGEGLILAFVKDLSELKLAEQEVRKSQAREALLKDISTQIFTEMDLQTILQVTVQRLRSALEADRVVAYQFFPDHNGICLAEDVALAYPKMLGQKFLSECIPPAYIEAYRRGRLSSVADVHTLASVACFRDMLDQFQVRSLMATAIVSMNEALEPQNCKLWGLLVVHHCRLPREWTEAEQQLIRAVANQVATALKQTQLLHQLQIHTYELESREHEQRLSAEHFRSFLEKSTDVFVEYDSDLRYVSINPAGCHLLGLPLEQVIGKTNRELLGPIGENLESLIRGAFDTGEKVFVDHEFHLPTGVRVFETIYAPIANPAGTVQRVIGICRDVTELKQHWQFLETQNHQLTETTRLKEEFVATTSHELRTPLTAILGFSNVLLQEFFGELNPKQKDYLERIHTSGQHLLDLINDILDLSRLEADRLELDCQTVFVPDICEGVISLIQERAINQGLRLEIDIDPHVEWVVADPRRLKQMLLNLLTNAVKFTQEGSIGLKVYRRSNLAGRLSNESFQAYSEQPLSIPSGTIHFQIWDTGIGIDEADQKLLFAPFAQIDSSLSRKHQGTGLGLVITRKLAELHGGTVSVKSSRNQGAQFTISLPMQGMRG